MWAPKAARILPFFPPYNNCFSFYAAFISFIFLSFSFFPWSFFPLLSYLVLFLPLFVLFRKFEQKIGKQDNKSTFVRKPSISKSFLLCLILNLFSIPSFEKESRNELRLGTGGPGRKVGPALELTKTTTCRKLGHFKQKLFECSLSLMSYISSERWPKKGFYDL